MGTIDLNYERHESGDSRFCDWLSKDEFAKFNIQLLELDDVGERAKTISVLAAVFDLEGFTSFCSQPDSQLMLPRFLDSFLKWLFETIRSGIVQGKPGDKVHLYSPLPFFGKFTGDGVIFLWDAKDLNTDAKMGNTVITLINVCAKYGSQFLKKNGDSFPRVPARLRVGAALGRVASIGGGRDYVGSCINTASRLQKLGSLSFALHKKGFELEKCFSGRTRSKLCIARVPLRGISDDELVIVPRAEIEALPEDKRTFFNICT